jgi:predicted transcriptional regulator
VSRLQQLGEHTDRREAMLLAEQSVAQEKAMQREAALRAELDWS